MTVKRATKEALIGSSIIFTTTDAEFIERVHPNTAHNFVDVVSLDGLGGNPVIPTAGDYLITVKTNDRGGFKAIQDNGTLSAALTGGSALADGVAEGASFDQSPLEIKVTPIGVDVAAAFAVYITQNLT